jgi:hypothetical protein
LVIFFASLAALYIAIPFAHPGGDDHCRLARFRELAERG